MLLGYPRMNRYTLASRTLCDFYRAAALLMLVTCLVAATASLAPSVALAAENTEIATGIDNGDPFETFNRSMYRFNDRVDRAVLKPIAQRYVRYVPPKVRRGVKNFVSNLREPTTIVNDLLQGKVTQAAGDTMRFLINSTFGLLGIFDVASHLDLPRNDEDFGQTFAKWGLPSGPYLVLPFLGPSTVRDAVGLVPQYMYTDLASGVEEEGLMWTIFAARAVDTRADLLKADNLLAEQLDPYVFVRETYRQRRLSEIHDGEPPVAEDAYLDEILKESE